MEDIRIGRKTYANIGKVVLAGFRVPLLGADPYRTFILFTPSLTASDVSFYASANTADRPFLVIPTASTAILLRVQDVGALITRAIWMESNIPETYSFAYGGLLDQ